MAKQSRLANVSDETLASMTAKEIGEKWYGGNTGAGYNAAIARGIKPKSANGAQAKTVTAKPIAAPVVTAKVVAKPAKAEIDTLPLPGRVEAYFEYRLGWDMTYPIQAHHVELLILADDVTWNQLAMKFGPEEIAMIGAFLESGGYCPVARVSQRADWLAEKANVAAAKRIADSISAIAAIDNRLANQRARFEASRFDADITAFYAA